MLQPAPPFKATLAYHFFSLLHFCPLRLLPSPLLAGTMPRGLPRFSPGYRTMKRVFEAIANED